MKLHKYSEQDLRDAVAQSTSVRQVLIKLGVAPYGGNYAVFWKAVSHFSIDISHFNGQGWSKGRKFQPKRDIQKYLSNEFPCTSNRLRLRLILEGIFPHKCSNCKKTEWLDKPIPLELEHKNGNRLDNTLSNLCLLCPNCHAFTSTYRGRAKRKNGGGGGTRTHKSEDTEA